MAFDKDEMVLDSSGDESVAWETVGLITPPRPTPRPGWVRKLIHRWAFAARRSDRARAEGDQERSASAQRRMARVNRNYQQVTGRSDIRARAIAMGLYRPAPPPPPPPPPPAYDPYAQQYGQPDSYASASPDDPYAQYDPSTYDPNIAGNDVGAVFSPSTWFMTKAEESLHWEKKKAATDIKAAKEMASLRQQEKAAFEEAASARKGIEEARKAAGMAGIESIMGGLCGTSCYRKGLD